MFSNHHEIMLILIFTSKLPRERGELFFKKNTPYHMSIPINVKHLPRALPARRGALDRCGGTSLHLQALQKALHRDVPKDP